ncbi:MAG TPA: type I-U CRISPR-associated RAMP protein Csb1/Cas7u [Tepidisphaeraceae bacterium]|nr:type I-U CRISPR-associated RAMP protein Csb1/Cas7u [Tepidisphaeraceae bacterium]
MNESSAKLSYRMLCEAVADRAVAIRCRTQLQPAAGPGTKVFPPTHAGGVYATEKRRLPDRAEPVDCVLLDSVQSQANRIEDALQEAVDRGLIKIPMLVVEFGDQIEDVQRVTSLQAPHRAADAILRDSLVAEKVKEKADDGTEKEIEKSVPFRKSEIGDAITNSSIANATGLYRYCPHALVLGIWDSTGPKGGLGAKFARALVSEIVGIDAVDGVRSRSRIDTLQIGAKSGPIYRRPDGQWTVDPDEALQEEKRGVPTGKAILYRRNKQKANVTFEPGPLFAREDDTVRKWTYHPKLAKKVKESVSTVTLHLFNRDETYDIERDLFEADALANNPPKEGKPSAANHGNVTPDIKDEDGSPLGGGGTVEYAEHTAVLSLPQLRRLRFPIDGKLDPKIDDAARTVLAALALVGLTLSMERGADLRSRCLLFPETALQFELLATPGKPEAFTLKSAQAMDLLNQAVDAATKAGLPWETEPVTLTPSPELIALVKKSQDLAKTGEEGE